jgi:hypothetical protein
MQYFLTSLSLVSARVIINIFDPIKINEEISREVIIIII